MSKSNHIKVISSKTACEKLGLARATFNRRVARGEIPSLGKLDGQNGAHVFDADVIDAIASKQHKAAS